MGINYVMSATCDKCGEMIEPPKMVKKGEINSTRWDWQRHWKLSGVMQGLPNRYGKSTLFCARCAGS